MINETADIEKKRKNTLIPAKRYFIPKTAAIVTAPAIESFAIKGISNLIFRFLILLRSAIISKTDAIKVDSVVPSAMPAIPIFKTLEKKILIKAFDTTATALAFAGVLVSFIP